MGIGMQFRGVTLHELRKDVAAGAAFAVILAVLATGFTLAAHRLGGAPILDAFLSFAPGGQAEMTVLAIVVGADLGFVVIHHLMRLVVVITGAPIVARLIWGEIGVAIAILDGRAAGVRPAVQYPRAWPYARQGIGSN